MGTFYGFKLTDADNKLIAKLKPLHRAIIRDNRPYTMIAEDLGETVGTVKSRLHRARAKLVELRKGAAT